MTTNDTNKINNSDDVVLYVKTCKESFFIEQISPIRIDNDFVQITISKNSNFYNDLVNGHWFKKWKLIMSSQNNNQMRLIEHSKVNTSDFIKKMQKRDLKSFAVLIWGLGLCEQKNGGDHSSSHNNNQKNVSKYIWQTPWTKGLFFVTDQHNQYNVFKTFFMPPNGQFCTNVEHFQLFCIGFEEQNLDLFKHIVDSAE